MPERALTHAIRLGPAGRRSVRTAAAGLAVAGTGAALGLGILVAPEAALALVAVGLLGTVAFTFPDRYIRATTVFIAVVLVGYATLGRGFAYIGVRPVFVGEVALGLGVAAALVSGAVTRTFRSPVAWLLLAYMVWGLVCTVPYLGVHGVDALRDAVLWGYGAFAFIVAAVLLRTGAWARVVGLYRTGVPWLMVYLPFGYALSEIYDSYLPRIPGSGVLIPQLKPGDVAVHLAGSAAFLLLGLWAGRGDRRRSLEWLIWVFWLAAFVLVSSQNRGGMVSVAVALMLLAVLRPSWRWLKIGIAGVLFIGTVLALDVKLDISGNREVSARQLASNAASVFGYEPKGVKLQNTVEWRTRWWGDIVDYTVRGPYFWTGKGYGINLADADGYHLNREGSLRSPHNGHLTVLARSGVPGIALWLLLHATFAVSLLRAYWRARREANEGWALVNVWILAYWTAFMVNATFDVFLEGPQGGIWFWSLMGFGLAALRLQRDGRESPAEVA